MNEMDGVIGYADLRTFVRVKKFGHKPEYTLLALGGYGAASGGGAIDRRWIGIGIEVIETDPVDPGRTRCWGYGKRGRTILLLRRGRRSGKGI
jgi:hypothetical protein